MKPAYRLREGSCGSVRKVRIPNIQISVKHFLFVVNQLLQVIPYFLCPSFAGVFASFISLLGKAARRSPVPSLGASGGICAVLGAFCMLQPHARLCVPFVVDLVPHSFEAGSAALVLLTLEFCSSFIFASRSPVDHAAHMGGLIFGM